jgi:hypothetical protein
LSRFRLIQAVFRPLPSALGPLTFVRLRPLESAGFWPALARRLARSRSDHRPGRALNTGVGARAASKSRSSACRGIVGKASDAPRGRVRPAAHGVRVRRPTGRFAVAFLDSPAMSGSRRRSRRRSPATRAGSPSPGYPGSATGSPTRLTSFGTRAFCT